MVRRRSGQAGTELAKARASWLRETLTLLGMDPDDVAAVSVRMGVSPETVTSWLDGAKLPRQAFVAIDVFCRMADVTPAAPYPDFLPQNTVLMRIKQH